VRPPAQAVAFQAGTARIDDTPLRDGHMHFFEVDIPEGPVRFFAVQVGKEVKLCFDACEICGDKGYFEDKKGVVCRNCTSPIALSSIGRTGGCNPIPLPNHLENRSITIAETDFRSMYPHLKGR